MIEFKPINWDQHPKAIDILLKRREQGASYNKISKELNKEFGFSLNEHMTKRAYNKYSMEKKVAEAKGMTLQEAVEQSVEEDLPSYKETVEIGSDGSHKSDKLLRMSAEQSKDVNFLLDAHGYDRDAWELVSARNNIWNSYSKQDGIMTMYASKITVRPRTNGFSIEQLIEVIKEETRPVVIPTKNVSIEDRRLLEIPFFDPHFGVSDYAYYMDTQAETLELIQSRKWEEILFIIGQDMFHNNDFRGNTASGTPIEVVDMPQAWRDCRNFYYPLIEAAVTSANEVKIMFSKGNHDEAISWAFIQMMKERYPQVEFDDSFIERKVHTFGEIFIGVTHGDKGKKVNYHKLFSIEFPFEWGQAKTREIHSGHFHIEDAKDDFGVMNRTLSTRNKTDKWHKDNGFVGGHKRFMLFEYDEQELKKVHYV